MAASESTRRVRDELALLRSADGQLLAACRATVAAARDGWSDPVGIVAGLLEERGQLPGPDQHPAELLAQASLPHYADDQVFYLGLDPAADGPESPKASGAGPGISLEGAVTQVTKFMMWLFWAGLVWFIASAVADLAGL